MPSNRTGNSKSRLRRERVYVPVRAIDNIEHERGDNAEEIKFQITWQLT